MYHVLDMSGRRFGRLVVGKRVEDNRYGQPMFECKCDCGRIHVAQKSSLVRQTKGVRSCGCLYRKAAIRRHSNARKLAKNGLSIPFDIPKHLAKRLSGIKARSRQRGLIWDLSDEKLLSLVVSPCHYCGAENKNGVGVDRIDSKGSYTEDNCVSCCKYCNHAKQDRSVQEFREWAVSLYNRFC